MKLNEYIDHTNLSPTATQEDIERLCQEAKEHRFHSVCVNPCWVSLAKKCLLGSNVLVACVIGFPLGANSTEIKVEEAKLATSVGADELDMVMNEGWFKMKKYSLVADEINRICEISKLPVKVIVETSKLTEEEIIEACNVVNSTKAQFIKTSTGFIGEGAKLEDVVLMKKYISSNKEVKASGGIRDKETALKFIEAGATRLGTSSGVNIVKAH